MRSRPSDIGGFDDLLDEVAGTFSLSAGNPTASGPGWKASRTSLGVFSITFNPAWSRIDAVLLQVGDGLNPVVPLVGANTLSSVAFTVSSGPTGLYDPARMFFLVKGRRAER